MGSSSQQFKSNSINIDAHVGRTLDEVEKDLIVATILRCGGNKNWAADILGLSIPTLRNKLNRYSQSVPRDPFKKVRDTESFDEDAMTVRLRAYNPGDRAPS